MTAFCGRRGVRLLAITAVVLSLAGGVAYATIPDSGNVFTACMAKKGTIRLIDPSLGGSTDMGHCNPLETQIKFNQQGQKGDPGQPGIQGPKGDPGPQGVPGPAGPAGSLDPSRLYIATATTDGNGTNQAGYVNATCDAGDLLLSGGFSQSFQPQAKILGSSPENNLYRTDEFGPAWTVKYQFLPAGEEVDSFAICMQLN